MEIEYYVRDRGDSPVSDFLYDHSLPPKHSAKIIRDIDRLKEYGLQLLLKTEDAKKFKGNKKHDGLYELITNYQGIYYRTMFTVIKDKYWLISIFKKKSNKTSLNEIEKANNIKEFLKQKYGL